MDWNKVLEAVSGALSVVQTIAKTPGISMLPYVNTISGAIDIIQAAASVGKNIAPFLEQFKKTFTPGNIPTAAEVAALDSEIARLEAEIQASLPPPEEGEPD
jgi:hypothetical protein